MDRLLPKTMAEESPKAQIYQAARPHYFSQRVEDNAFHLGSAFLEVRVSSKSGETLPHSKALRAKVAQ